MQGGEEVRSEAYSVVRCNDERRSQRRRWAFFISLLGGMGRYARQGVRLRGRRSSTAARSIMASAAPKFVGDEGALSHDGDLAATLMLRAAQRTESVRSNRPLARCSRAMSLG